MTLEPSTRSPSAKPSDPEELRLPDKLTLRFLFDHVPVSWWAWIGGGAFSLFMLGTQVPHLLSLLGQQSTPSPTTMPSLNHASETAVVHEPPSSDDIGKATASIRVQLELAVSERNAARQELEAVKRQLTELNKQVSAPDIRNSNQNDGPITWENSLWFFQGQNANTIRFVVFRGQNTRNSASQIKSAYLMSDITGNKHSMLINIPFGTLDGERISVDKSNPIPPGARIQLVAEWSPAIHVLEFMNNWGRTNLLIDFDEGAAYRRIFDENFMRAALARDIVGASLILGVPRVTKKDPDK